MRRLRLFLILDTTLLLSLIVLMVPRSNLIIHEWLGISVISLILIHLLFAWRWIATTLVRIRADGAWRLRFNALLNTLLFVAFVVTLFSGIMASVIVMPALGISVARDESWLRLHNSWSNYLLLLAGLHVGMNGSWIIGTVRRLVLRQPTARGDAAIAAVAGELPGTRP